LDTRIVNGRNDGFCCDKIPFFAADSFSVTKISNLQNVIFKREGLSLFFSTNGDVQGLNCPKGLNFIVKGSGMWDEKMRMRGNFG